MKMVIAYIKPHKVSAVTTALHTLEDLSGMSVGDVRGFGRGRARNAPHRVVEDLVDYVPHARIEVACHDEITDQVVETIEIAAHTGLRGDGKIYVIDLEQAVRIESGERGEKAV
ncbi:P-II family nitrogen regulator [bacterium]|nr:P-II family nitrogen regulator [bacterium]